MNIVILVGSSDAESHSLHLGKAIQDRLVELDSNVDLLNLIDCGLPLYDRRVERDESYSQKIKDFIHRSSNADAFVWITPIYHNSYSAVLKNALDWHHATEFTGKVLGLASNGGNRSPQAVDQLTLVARSQGMITIPTRVCTDSTDFDESLQVSDESIKKRINDFCLELIDLTSRLSS